MMNGKLLSKEQLDAPRRTAEPGGAARRSCSPLMVGGADLARQCAERCSAGISCRCSMPIEDKKASAN
ncbi:MAG: hypothetical protein MZV70_34195 [Desulfobacterales bacterium]|nr:hypothetical protein [Desulfobacterales bacterium]